MNLLIILKIMTFTKSVKKIDATNINEISVIGSTL